MLMRGSKAYIFETYTPNKFNFLKKEQRLCLLEIMFMAGSSLQIVTILTESLPPAPSPSGFEETHFQV